MIFCFVFFLLFNLFSNIRRMLENVFYSKIKIKKFFLNPIPNKTKSSHFDI